jgi:gliding motility-associated-like protein
MKKWYQADPSLGQYPNVYYTFPDGGAYEISLKVFDISAPLDTAAYTKIIELLPVFGNDRVDFENIPNVFTPGGANNNYFKVETAGTNKLSFKVFSRTGALVYEYEGNIIKWDGNNYYGNELPQGIYYYILEDISTEKRYNPAKGFFYIYR